MVEFLLLKDDNKFIISYIWLLTFPIFMIALYFLHFLSEGFDSLRGSIIENTIVWVGLIIIMRIGLMYAYLFFTHQFIKIEDNEITYSNLLNLSAWPFGKILFSSPKGEINVKFSEPIMEIETSLDGRYPESSIIRERNGDDIEITVIRKNTRKQKKVKYMHFTNLYFSDPSGKKIILLDILKNYGGVTVIERPKMCLKPITRKNILKFVHSPIQGVDKLFEECDQK